MASLAPSVSDLRTIVNDPNTASGFNLSRGENLQLPQGAAVSTNTIFYLSNVPIVPNSVYITSGSPRSQSGFTVDATNGLITFTTAPGASGSLPIPFYADYNFNFFTDSDYIFFIGKGLELLGYAAGISGVTTTTLIDEALFPACYEFAKAYFYQRRATQYADRYSATGGGQGTSVSQVVEHFQKLADQSYKDGIVKRDDYYKRQGQREAPSSHFFNYGISPTSGSF